MTYLSLSLAPGLRGPHVVLAIDPGYAAGCKCAIVGPDGRLAPETIFRDHDRHTGVGSDGLFSVYPLRGRPAAVSTLASHLRAATAWSQSMGVGMAIGVGDGHGSSEAVALAQDAISSSIVKGKKVMQPPVSVVREAGASVWSASPSASAEFPGMPPAAIGAVSLARRLQDPLGELVKVCFSRMDTLCNGLSNMAVAEMYNANYLAMILISVYLEISSSVMRLIFMLPPGATSRTWRWNVPARSCTDGAGQCSSSSCR